MFKEIFIRLCNEKGVAPTAACVEIGLSNATFSCWTETSIPRKATLMRIADYFGVSTDYLLGNVDMDLQHFAEKEKGPTVTVDPKLLSLIDSMSEEELADLERYAEFILSKKGKK
jgi:transcriptional regulator with XRE-family HTH domain